MYEFECTDFALSQSGIHLLRSGHNYQTIDYNELNNVTIKKDSEVKNVLLAVIVGIALIAYALFHAVAIISQFINPTVYRIEIEMIVLPVLPGIVGAYLLFISLRKRLVLLLETDKKKYKLRMRDFMQQGKTNDVISFLKKKLSYRVSVVNEK